jgi:hypothetical protein
MLRSDLDDEHGYTVEELGPLPNGKAADGPTPLQPIGLKEFLALQFPPREMVLAPWLPVGGLAMLYATRGIGKTHVALEIAFAAATGGSFLRW